MFFSATKYRNGGKGYCSDGSSNKYLPSLYFTSSSYDECESNCNVLADCVAFDVGHVAPSCQLRFSSLTSLRNSPNPQGYTKGEALTCGDNCKTTNIRGRKSSIFDPATGTCWIKEKGK